jgi:hypothetical protein
MHCEEIEKLMIDYLDKNLQEGYRNEIEKHLETCEGCLDELNEMQKVLNLMSEEVMEKPNESLGINFYHMLHSQIRNSDKNQLKIQKSDSPWYTRGSYRIAAGIALLICGTFLGLLIRSGLNSSYAANELKQLHMEMSDLKKNTLFTMLKEESSSGRIQAVRYVEEIDNPDENVIEVLVKTLNYDKNVNVRMAAAYALSKFVDQKAVRDSLVGSLSIQSDPILQVTLINILAEIKEKSALRPIQEIISDKSTLNEVRTVAENSLRVLI